MKLNNTLHISKRLLCALLFFYTSAAFSQNIPVSKDYPKNYFRPPLDLPPTLAGSFGEIRPNHLHSGTDYRTNQREGYPVYAVADGYVSRLRIQIGGFGNAVYITHPNGFTSVYAHLQRFNDKIAQLIKSYQYQKKVYDVDFPLLPVEILVKKGEIIAWSGNTGGSGGPHLHLEIRDSQTEETIHPQLFGLDVPDKIKPTIAGLYMYRLNGQPFNENTPRQYFELIETTDGNYNIRQSPVINFSGEIGFGIITFDRQAAGNKNGVYSIELQMDDIPIFQSAVERFAFQDSRGVNSHIDYAYNLLYKRTIQKSFIEPGNPLKIYKIDVNRGVITNTDEKVHQMKYIVKDVAGNMSTVNFKIKYNPKSVIVPKEIKGLKLFPYNQVNDYSTESMKINIPKGILYSDINFRYEQSARPANAYSALHKIHTRLVPLHAAYNLWIKADSSLPVNLQSKALIVDSRGVSQGGTFENGFVKATPRIFGNFYIVTDTIAPVIRPLNITEGKSMTGINSMRFKISDNLSGIRTFTGTIDGQWVLMEFDSKTSVTWHTFDSLAPGKHEFRLTVTDMKMNSKTYKVNFTR